MIKITCTQEQKDIFFEEYQQHSHSKIRRRMGILFFKSEGLAHQEICRLFRISRPTLSKTLQLYKEQGLEGIKTLNYKGQPSKLHPFSDLIKKEFDENPVSTMQQARQRIKELTGLERSPTQIRLFLKKLGLKYLKTGNIPGGEKGDSDKKKKERAEWLKNELQPRLDEAKEGKRVVLFVDAAHFIYSAYAGFLWCFQRVFLASPSGRKRFNVLGGIDAVTKELIMVTNDSYINAKSVCLLLKKIYLKYLPSGLKITLVLDNARYQKCKLVRRYARCLGIELLYMPSYSPQLNLIERLWKFVKKQTLYAKYYPNFDDFKSAIQGCLHKTNTSFKPKLDTLLSWNFQSFENVKKLTV